MFLINNMIPVPDVCVTQFKYNTVNQFRSFKNEKEKNDYIYLLQKEKKHPLLGRQEIAVLVPDK